MLFRVPRWPANTMSPTRKLSFTTPGVVSTKSMKLRPLAGRFWMALSLTTESTCDLVDWMSGASPVTVTAAWTPAGSITSRREESPPTATLTLAARLVANPGSSAVTE